MTVIILFMNLQFRQSLVRMMCLCSTSWGRGALGGWELNTPEDFLVYLVVDAGCWQGPQLRLSTEMPSRGLFMWLLVFVTACAGSQGQASQNRTRLEVAPPLLT